MTLSHHLQHYEPLTEDQTRRLIRRARRRGAVGRAAAETLVTRNIRLIVKTANFFRGYQSSVVDSDDVFQFALIGYLNAIRLFDLNAKNRFSTYAVRSMRNTVQRGLDNSALDLRIPVHLSAKKRRRNRAINTLTAAGLSPTQDDIARAAQLTRRQLDKLNRLPTIAFSLDEPLSPDDGRARTELIADPVGQDDGAIDRPALHRFLTEALTPKQYSVVTLRFGLNPDYPDGLSIDKVGQKLGLRSNQVDTLFQVARETLRLPIFACQLRGLLNLEAFGDE